MIVLGIETSCDETAAAVLDGGRKVLSSVVASQDEVHAPYGGVVPELASRRHLEMIVPVIRRALRDAFFDAKIHDAVNEADATYKLLAAERGDPAARG